MMRPVSKGVWPTRTNSATKLVFVDWTNARPALVERTGEYCHICEIALPMGLAVEHILPKKHFDSLSSSWSNFLLICSSCNSRKKNVIPNRPHKFRYYWPHLNNTLMAFWTPIGGPGALLVTPHVALRPEQVARASATISLYKLDEKVLASGEADNRYRRKVVIASKALNLYLDYKQGQCSLRSITDSVITDGFFSLWLEVFKDETVVIDAILDLPEFRIDRQAWFDAHNQPVGRHPGRADPI